MALIVYFVIYVCLAVVWRAVVVYRRFGVNPIVLVSADDANGYVGKAFKTIVVFSAIVVTLNFHSGSAFWLSPILFLALPMLNAVGWILLCVSLLWVLVAQSQMGASWRIGIDSEMTTDIVRNGLFGISRNPIFLSVRVTLIGLFLVVPSAATLAIAVAGEILVQVQVRLEEGHLRDVNGEPYIAYQSAVRRWL